MKHLIFGLTFMSLITSSFAIDLIGEFESKKEIYFFNYLTQVDCQMDGGKWEVDSYDSELGICKFEASDDVVIKESASSLLVSVSTLGTNAHSCIFEGEAQVLSDNKIQAAVETEIYDPKTDSFEKATCLVDILFKNENTVSVATNGLCSEFCGARAWLEIEEAKRKY